MNKFEKLKKNTRKEFLLIIKEQEEEIEYIFEEAAKKKEKNQNKISDIAALLLFLKKLFSKMNSDIYSVINKNLKKVIDVYGDIDLRYMTDITSNEYILNSIKKYSNDNKKDVVKTILKGLIYADLLSLKKRCTKSINRTLNLLKKKVNNLSNKSDDITISEIITDTENIINPKVKDKKLLYDANRLARTTLIHSVREIIKENAKDNIFNIGIKWELSPDHWDRMPDGDECDVYAENDMYGLGIGIFPVDEVPFQHINCLCSLYPVMLDYNIIAERIENWINGASDNELEDWIKQNEIGADI